MPKFKKRVRPGLVATVFVLAFTLYSCGPILVPMFEGISEETAVGLDIFTRWMAHFIAQAVMLFVVVYWITSRLTRDPNEAVKSVVNENTR